MKEIKLGFIGGNNWQTLEATTVRLTNGKDITIPLDFITDLSSTPKSLWGLFPPFGNFLLGAIVHDYLYHCNREGIDLGFEVSRKFADDQMLYFSDLNSKNKIDNRLRYSAVRLFGNKNWNKK
jgi:hypothetical protein